jgi:hypothetical protein
MSFHSLSTFLLSIPFVAPQETAPAPSVAVRTIAATSSPVKRFALDEKQTRIALVAGARDVSLVLRAKDERIWERSGDFFAMFDVEIAGDFVIATSIRAMYEAFELDSGKPKQSTGAADFEATTTCSAVDPQARWIWIGSDNDVLQRITPGVMNGWSRRNVGHGGSTAMALSPDGDLLAVAGADRTIRFANSKSAQVDDKKVFEGLDSPALTLAFDLKSALLASTGEDKVVRLWTVASGKTKTKLTGHEGVVRALAFDPKSARLAAGDDKGAVKVWSVDKGEVLFELPNAGGGAVTDLEFVDKGKALLGACGVNGLLLWDLSKL